MPARATPSRSCASSPRPRSGTSPNNRSRELRRSSTRASSDNPVTSLRRRGARRRLLRAGGDVGEHRLQVLGIGVVLQTAPQLLRGGVPVAALGGERREVEIALG